MLKKILAALALLGSVASAFMFILLKKFKSDNERDEAKVEAETARRIADTEEAARKAENAVAKKKAETEAEDEKLNQRMHSGDGLDSFNAGIDLLRKQAERGNKRNTRAGSSRA